jgi:hypothetical protein
MNGILFYRLDIKENRAHVGYVKDAEMIGHEEEISAPTIIEFFPKKGRVLREQKIGFKFFFRIPEDVHDCMKEIFEQKLW